MHVPITNICKGSIIYFINNFNIDLRSKIISPIPYDLRNYFTYFKVRPTLPYFMIESKCGRN